MEPVGDEVSGPAVVEHAVLVHLAVSGDSGSTMDRLRQWRLQRRLEQAVARAGVGECDGTLFGEDEVVFYLYGPDAARLWQAVQPVLRSLRVGPGYALLRPGGPQVDAERVDF